MARAFCDVGTPYCGPDTPHSLFDPPSVIARIVLRGTLLCKGKPPVRVRVARSCTHGRGLPRPHKPHGHEYMTVPPNVPRGYFPAIAATSGSRGAGPAWPPCAAADLVSTIRMP